MIACWDDHPFWLCGKLSLRWRITPHFDYFDFALSLALDLFNFGFLFTRNLTFACLWQYAFNLSRYVTIWMTPLFLHNHCTFDITWRIYFRIRRTFLNFYWRLNFFNFVGDPHHWRLKFFNFIGDPHYWRLNFFNFNGDPHFLFRFLVYFRPFLFRFHVYFRLFWRLFFFYFCYFDVGKVFLRSEFWKGHELFLTSGWWLKNYVWLRSETN